MVTQPVIRIIEVGETLRIPCEAYHVNKIPITIRWIKLDGEFSNRVYEEQGVLIITNAQNEDSGEYECRASTGREYGTGKVTITVGASITGPSYSRPEVHVSPSYIDDNEYSSPELHCHVTGFPTPRTRWERLDGRLSHDVVVHQGTLRFNSIRKSDEGTYICIAENSVGRNDATIEIYVRQDEENTYPTEPPSPPHDIRIIPDNYVGHPGAEVILTCGNDANAYVSWNK